MEALAWGNLVRTGVLYMVALAWMQVCQQAVRRGIARGELSRKLVHIGIGVLFVLCWSIYDGSCSDCRYLAASVPAAVLLKLLLVAAGILHDQETVDMLCRGGKREAILYGPTIYGVVLVALTCLYWRSSLAIVPIMALYVLCMPGPCA